jgi:hypothetical protein
MRACEHALLSMTCDQAACRPRPSQYAASCWAPHAFGNQKCHGQRVQVGLVTYGTHVHVHELGFSECAKSYVFQVRCVVGIGVYLCRHA